MSLSPVELDPRAIANALAMIGGGIVFILAIMGIGR
jgi:hypothetical protein